jgi:hypothetical protein
MWVFSRGFCLAHGSDRVVPEVAERQGDGGEDGTHVGVHLHWGKVHGPG